MISSILRSIISIIWNVVLSSASILFIFFTLLLAPYGAIIIRQRNNNDSLLINSVLSSSSSVVPQLHRSIPPGDSGEFLGLALAGSSTKNSINNNDNKNTATVVATAGGFAHPPGYGLYTFFLSRIWVPHVSDRFLIPILQIMEELTSSSSIITFERLVFLIITYHDKNESPIINHDIKSVCLRKINGIFTNYYDDTVSSSPSSSSKKTTGDIFGSSCDLVFMSVHASSLFFASIAIFFMSKAGWCYYYYYHEEESNTSRSITNIPFFIIILPLSILSVLGSEPSNRYSTEVEVFSMNNAIIAFGFYSSVKLHHCYYHQQQQNPSFLMQLLMMMSGFVLGLGAGHQHAILFAALPTILHQTWKFVVTSTTNSSISSNKLLQLLTFVVGFVCGVLPSAFSIFNSSLILNNNNIEQQQQQQQPRVAPFFIFGERTTDFAQALRNTLDIFLRKYYGTFQMMKSEDETSLSSSSSSSIFSVVMDPRFHTRILLHCAWLWANYQFLILTTAAAATGIMMIMMVTLITEKGFTISSSKTNFVMISILNLASSIILFALFSSTDFFPTNHDLSSSSSSIVEMHVHERFWLQSVPCLAFVAMMSLLTVFQKIPKTFLFCVAVFIIIMNSSSSPTGDILIRTTSPSPSSSSSSTSMLFSSSLIRSALSSSSSSRSDDEKTTTTTNNNAVISTITLLITSGDITFAPTLALEALSAQKPIVHSSNSNTNNQQNNNNKKCLLWIDSSLSSNSWYRKQYLIEQQLRSGEEGRCGTLLNNNEDADARVKRILLDALDKAFSSDNSIINLQSLVQDLLLTKEIIFNNNRRRAIRFEIVTLVSPSILPQLPTLKNLGRNKNNNDNDEERNNIQIESLPGALHKITANNNNKKSSSTDDDDDEEDDDDETTISNKYLELQQNIYKILSDELVIAQEEEDDDSNYKKKLKAQSSSLLHFYIGLDFYPASSSSSSTSSPSVCYQIYLNAQASMNALERIRHHHNFKKLVRFFSRRPRPLVHAWDVDLNKLCAISIQNSFQRIVLDLVEYHSSSSTIKTSSKNMMTLVTIVTKDLLDELKSSFYDEFVLLPSTSTNSYSPLSIMSTEDRKEIYEGFYNRIFLPALELLEKKKKQNDREMMMLMKRNTADDDGDEVDGGQEEQNPHGGRRKKNKDFRSW